MGKGHDTRGSRQARAVKICVKVVQQPGLGGLLLILVEGVPAAAASRSAAMSSNRHLLCWLPPSTSVIRSASRPNTCLALCSSTSSWASTMANDTHGRPLKGTALQQLRFDVVPKRDKSTSRRLWRAHYEGRGTVQPQTAGKTVQKKMQRDVSQPHAVRACKALSRFLSGCGRAHQPMLIAHS